MYVNEGISVKFPPLTHHKVALIYELMLECEAQDNRETFDFHLIAQKFYYFIIREICKAYVYALQEPLCWVLIYVTLVVKIPRIPSIKLDNCLGLGFISVK